MKLVDVIIPRFINHNEEPEAVDLMMESSQKTEKQHFIIIHYKKGQTRYIEPGTLQLNLQASTKLKKSFYRRLAREKYEDSYYVFLVLEVAENKLILVSLLCYWKTGVKEKDLAKQL